MKVPAAQQRQLLDLADLDAEIARQRFARAHLPEDETIVAIDERIESARDDVARAEVAVDALEREYERIDAELTGMSDHAKRDQAQIDAGLVAPKVLAELQHELTGLIRRRDVLESELLEVMEQQEATGAELARAQSVLTAADTERAEAVAHRDTHAEQVDGKIEDLSVRRADVLGGVPDELTGIYEKLRSQGKVGAGLFQARRCGACRMEMDPRTIQRIAQADDDEVLRCEECGAIIIRTAHSGLPTGPKSDD
ncbi:MAG: C4-type zinc ribbon domain-containing protein [Gordonia sp. (in: high G+C Gram-positive bacteria)]